MFFWAKRRSWILVFSRKERKDRKAYRDGGVLLDFEARPLFRAFTNRVNCVQNERRV